MQDTTQLKVIKKVNFLYDIGILNTEAAVNNIPFSGTPMTQLSHATSGTDTLRVAWRILFLNGAKMGQFKDRMTPGSVLWKVPYVQNDLFYLAGLLT
jgi:hypothetical protein